MVRERWHSPAELRTRVGLTQREVALAIGRRVQTISDWERGAARPLLTFIEVIKLRDLYEVTLEDLARTFDRVDPDEGGS